MPARELDLLGGNLHLAESIILMTDDRNRFKINGLKLWI